MYKNLYVVGAIELIGRIVSTPKDLVPAINSVLSRRQRSLPVAHHFSRVAPLLGDVVKSLEESYSPPWSCAFEVERWIKARNANKVLDVGCGSGKVAHYILDRNPHVFYVGYDASVAMIEAARERNLKGIFTSRFEDLVDLAKHQPFDLLVCAFVLHDVDDRVGFIRQALELISDGGSVLVIDLSRDDLPQLTKHLGNWFGRKAQSEDSRLSPDWIALTAEREHLVLRHCGLALPRVHFASADSIERYLEAFGIPDGMDLPLAFNGLSRAEILTEIRTRISLLRYPFHDQRVFVECLLSRH